MFERIILLIDEGETRREAAALAHALAAQSLAEQGFVIHLSGDLGAGKTTFVRAMLREFGFHGPVKSPSFTLLETYNPGSFPIYHFDLYRFSSPDQWFDAGFDDILAGPGLMLVEWPEQAAGALASPDLQLRLQPVDDDCPPGMPQLVDTPPGDEARRLTWQAHSTAGRQCLSDLNRLRPLPPTA